MENNIFIPSLCKVGYNRRQDTYTGKLGYICYFDKVWKLQSSWEKWRDKESEDLAPFEFNNEPISGFVLNKKVGGYGYWNARHTYCRIFDPRGFEIEISIDNLLYILENRNCIIGKGLEGEYVYGFLRGKVILIPYGTKECDNFIEYSKIKNKTTTKYKGGDICITSGNDRILYIDKHNNYTFYYDYNKEKMCRTSYNIKIVTIVDKDIELYNKLFEKISKGYDYIGIKTGRLTPTTLEENVDCYLFYHPNNKKLCMYDKVEGLIRECTELIENILNYSVDYERIFNFYWNSTKYLIPLLDNGFKDIQLYKLEYILNDNTIINAKDYNGKRYKNIIYY